MQECLREEVVQRYLDGELATEQIQAAAAHIRACALCAEAVREAQGEMELLTAAFAMHADVPTERLRERLDWAIAELASPMKPPKQSSADLDHLTPAWFPSFTGSNFNPLHAYALALIALGVTIGLSVYLNSRNSTGSTREVVAKTENNNHVKPRSDVNDTPVVNGPASTDVREIVKQNNRRDGPVRRGRQRRGVELKADQVLAQPRVVEDKQKGGQEQVATKNEDKSEEVKARLMLALHIASAKLNFAQKEVQRTLQRNRHEPAS